VSVEKIKGFLLACNLTSSQHAVDVSQLQGVPTYSLPFLEVEKARINQDFKSLLKILLNDNMAVTSVSIPWEYRLSLEHDQHLTDSIARKEIICCNILKQVLQGGKKE
jgi:hypothetical protein